jgi:uncharacterized protein YndB with AHSA1/START domain
MIPSPADALERLRSPAEAVTTIPAGPEEVFAALADPQTYPGWLTVARHVRTTGPISAALESDPPHRLVLEVQRGPATRRIEFLTERTSEGTQVRLRQHATGVLAWTMPGLRGLLHLEGKVSLDRLRARFEPLVISL